MRSKKPRRNTGKKSAMDKAERDALIVGFWKEGQEPLTISHSLQSRGIKPALSPEAITRIIQTHRNNQIIALRNAGYSYRAIALHLFQANLTRTELSAVAIEKIIKKVAPYLAGRIKGKLGLAKTTRRVEVENGSL